MGKIALFGAAGAIGRSVAAALRAARRPYRVVGRGRAALEAAYGTDPLAEIVTWNPDDPDSVRAAARGIDTIVYLIGVPYWQFAQHPVVMQQTLDGAIAERVGRLLLIGTVYPYGRPRTIPVREDHAREPHTVKGRMRKAQEELLLVADAAGKIRGTILRLPDFYGPDVEGSFLTNLFRSAPAGKRAAMIGPIDTPHEFVYVPDVGPVVLALIDEPRADGHVWHLGGAGTITQRAVALRVFALLGREPKLFVAGPWLVRLLGLFDRVMRELPEMHYLHTTPVILDDAAVRGLLPDLRKTSYDDGIRLTLEAMQEGSKAAR
jgi:nucleoside-diphosphate-sugar epimerase